MLRVERKFGKEGFQVRSLRGAAASPIVYGDTLIGFDGHDLQYIVCLEQKTVKPMEKNRV